MSDKRRSIGVAACCMLALPVLVPVRASAHCDGLDGPVVTAARRALETGDLKPALIWVQARDSAEVARTFSRAAAVRRLGSEARELADLHFFETLVRLHRAYEGAPYTGLKPAGRDLGPAIPAADRALDTADLSALTSVLNGAIKAGLEERFHHALEARRHARDDVGAGRRYVSAYVRFIHYAEELYRIASGGDGHEGEPEAPPHAH